MTHNRNKAATIWTLAITSLALFMVSLDNLVVTTALPVIRRDLHATISQLEWTVNAYTLTFAVLLLTGAALGDRFGRRRLFVLGLLLFTGASAFAALSTSANALDLARALQGVGGAIVTPLTLTLLSAAVPAERRGLALGIWGGIGGLAVAVGPLVGGAIVSGVSWHWIFWVNVPIGLVAAVAALIWLTESLGSATRLDLPAVGDWVALQAFPKDAQGIVHAILERRSRIVRVAAGTESDEQVLAANVDTLFIVTSLNRDFNVRLYSLPVVEEEESNGDDAIAS